MSNITSSFNSVSAQPLWAPPLPMHVPQYADIRRTYHTPQVDPLCKRIQSIVDDVNNVLNLFNDVIPLGTTIADKTTRSTIKTLEIARRALQSIKNSDHKQKFHSELDRLQIDCEHYENAFREMIKNNAFRPITAPHTDQPNNFFSQLTHHIWEKCLQFSVWFNPTVQNPLETQSLQKKIVAKIPKTITSRNEAIEDFSRYYSQSLSHFRKNEWNEAASTFSAGISKDVTIIPVKIVTKLNSLLIQIGKLDKDSDFSKFGPLLDSNIKEILKIDPNADTSLSAGLLLFLNGQYIDATNFLDIATIFNPLYTPFKEFNYAIMTGDKTKATKVLNRIVTMFAPIEQKRSQDGLIVTLLGHIYMAAFQSNTNWDNLPAPLKATFEIIKAIIDDIDPASRIINNPSLMKDFFNATYGIVSLSVLAVGGLFVFNNRQIFKCCRRAKKIQNVPNIQKIQQKIESQSKEVLLQNDIPSIAKQEIPKIDSTSTPKQETKFEINIKKIFADSKVALSILNISPDSSSVKVIMEQTNTKCRKKLEESQDIYKIALKDAFGPVEIKILDDKNSDMYRWIFTFKEESSIIIDDDKVKNAINAIKDLDLQILDPKIQKPQITITSPEPTSSAVEKQEKLKTQVTLKTKFATPLERLFSPDIFDETPIETEVQTSTNIESITITPDSNEVEFVVKGSPAQTLESIWKEIHDQFEIDNRRIQELSGMISFLNQMSKEESLHFAKKYIAIRFLEIYSRLAVLKLRPGAGEEAITIRNALMHFGNNESEDLTDDLKNVIISILLLEKYYKSYTISKTMLPQYSLFLQPRSLSYCHFLTKELERESVTEGDEVEIQTLKKITNCCKIFFTFDKSGLSTDMQYACKSGVILTIRELLQRNKMSLATKNRIERELRDKSLELIVREFVPKKGMEEKNLLTYLGDRLAHGDTNSGIYQFEMNFVERALPIFQSVIDSLLS